MALVPHSDDDQHKEYAKDKRGFVNKRENPAIEIKKPAAPVAKDGAK